LAVFSHFCRQDRVRLLTAFLAVFCRSDGLTGIFTLSGRGYVPKGPVEHFEHVALGTELADPDRFRTHTEGLEQAGELQLGDGLAGARHLGPWPVLDIAELFDEICRSDAIGAEAPEHRLDISEQLDLKAGFIISAGQLGRGIACHVADAGELA